ncbi:unnamed protein product, partial [Rotaria sordida]
MNAIHNQTQTNPEKKTSDNDDEVKDQNIQTQTEKGKKEQTQVKSSKQDNRKELPNKQINLSLFRSQNWCRTTSLTLDLYEEHKIDESDFELDDDDDDDIDKILIITPTLPSNRKHNQQNHDRTEELWHDRPKSSIEKTLTIISQEDMNAIHNQSQTNTEKKTSDNDDEVKDQNIQTQTEK